MSSIEQKILMILPRPLHFLPPFQSYLYLLSSSPDEEKKMKNPPDGDHASGGRVNAIKSPPQAALTFGQFRIFWGRYWTNICEVSENLLDWVFFLPPKIIRASYQSRHLVPSYLNLSWFSPVGRGENPKIPNYFFAKKNRPCRGGGGGGDITLQKGNFFFKKGMTWQDTMFFPFWETFSEESHLRRAELPS